MLGHADAFVDWIVGIGLAHSLVFRQILCCVSANFVTWVTDTPALLEHDVNSLGNSSVTYFYF